jgi:hypothetical protein
MALAHQPLEAGLEPAAMGLKGVGAHVAVVLEALKGVEVHVAVVPMEWLLAEVLVQEVKLQVLLLKFLQGARP